MHIYPLQLPIEQPLWCLLPALKEYPPSSGLTLQITFDDVAGARGLLSGENGQSIVPFSDLIGIPKTLQFNAIKLQQFLQDTYVKIQRGSNNHATILINQQMKGGGNDHSSHTQSYHSTSPPPPQLTPVAYNAGFVIRTLSYTGPGNTFLNPNGGIGQPTFSVVFQSSDAQARPNVVIQVWKKDYYSGEIQRLAAIKATHLQAKQSALTNKMTLEATRTSIVAALQTLGNDQGALRNLMKDEALLSQEIGEAKKALTLEAEKLSTAAKQIEEEKPEIRSLIELTSLMRRLGWEKFFSAHQPLQQFLARDAKLDYLISSACNDKGLLGTTAAALNQVIAHVEKAKNKEIVALIGNTGTGKSTAVNHLLGIPMRYISAKGGGTIQVADGHKEVAKIGHSKTQSQTLYAEVHEHSSSPFVFADCGGFFDTRGVTSDLSVVTSLKLTLESAKSIKLVLCFDSHLIGSDRGIHLSHSLALSLKSLLKDYRNHPNSLLLLFTKPARDLAGELFSSEDARAIITEMAEDLLKGSEEEMLYRFILRDGGKYIRVYDPLSDASRDSVYSVLKVMTPIQNPKEAFQLACTAETQVSLFEHMLKTATKANEFYKSHALFSQNIQKMDEKLKVLIAKKNTIAQQKTPVEAAIRTQEAFLKVNILAAIEEQLKESSQKIAALEVDITEVDTQIAAKDTTNFVTYQSNGSGTWNISGI